jgi:hypothetical protein
MTTFLSDMKNSMAVMLVVASVTAASAQDTLRTDVVDVVKAFKPILSEAIKIQSNPNPEIPETPTPVFTYEIPAKRLDGNPTLYTIKPLSLGTSLLPKLKNNYTRLGYGNYNTPLFETYLNSTRNKNFQGGLFFKHLSSNPDENRTFSNNVAYLYGKRFLSKGVVGADVYYYRNVVNLYGFEPENLPVTKDDIRQQFQTFDAKLSYQNIVKDTSKLGFKMDGTFYNFSDNRNGKENDFRLNGTFSKRLGGNPLEVKAGVNVTALDMPGMSTYNRTFVDINPTYKLQMDPLYIRLGFNSTFFSDSSGTDFFFFPVAEAGFAIIPNAFTTYIGITGNLQRNTYRSITNENPFVRTLGLNNTVNSFELYGGFKGILGPQTSFLLNASLANIDHMLFYVADSSKLYGQAVVFDTRNSSVFNVKAELNHEFGEQFMLGFVMNYYKYSLSIDAPFSRPTFTTHLNLGYNMGDKFLWKASIFTMNKRKTRELLADDRYNDVTLKGLVDLNLGLDYRYSKNVSLFVNLNNLANNQYQRWMNLPVYGINVVGGLTVSF